MNLRTFKGIGVFTLYSAVVKNFSYFDHYMSNAYDMDVYVCYLNVYKSSITD